MTTPKLRTLHRQAGLVASFFLVLAALTTLVLNHRKLFLPVKTDAGPYSQYLLSHAICASHPDRLLVGTSTGLFYSEDAGKTFIRVNLPVPAEQVVGVAFHPNEPTHYYAVLRGEGIFSSLDGGKLWTRVSFPSKSPIQSFHIGFDGTLSVLTPEGLHRRVQENWSLAPGSPSSEAGERNFLKLAYALHDGTFWGRAGVVLTDLVALFLLFLVASGWAIWRRGDR